MIGGIAGLLLHIKMQATARDYPRQCPHRSEQIGWGPDPANPAGRLRIWNCRRYGIPVTWVNCGERSKLYTCSQKVINSAAK